MREALENFLDSGTAFILLLLFFILSPILIVFIVFDYFGFNRDTSVLVFMPYALMLCAYFFNYGAGPVYKVFFYLHTITFIGVSLWSLTAFEIGATFYALAAVQFALAIIGIVFALLLLTKKADKGMW